MTGAQLIDNLGYRLEDASERVFEVNQRIEALNDSQRTLMGLMHDFYLSDLKTKVNNILKRIITDLNNILQKNEYYVNDMEGLYIIKDDKNNYRIITISMLHDVKNYYSVKFVMDLVYFNNKYYLNYLNIDERATNNILNTYVMNIY